MSRRTGLGKGLDALFEDNGSEKKERQFLDITEIEPDRNQPRERFDEQAITSLAESIKEHGIIQPLIVKPILGENYQIIAGERRFRAARMVGIKKVPVVILEVSDKEGYEISLIENLQREDLNPVEEAKGYERLMEEFGLTQDEVSNRLGKSRSAVANTLRLLKLPDEVLNFVKEGKLSEGQSRALLSLRERDEIIKAAKQAVDKGMSVRELENLSRRTKTKKKTIRIDKANNFYKELELSLKDELKRRIKIDVAAGDRGVLKVDFYNKEELLDMAYRLADIRREDR